MASSSSYQSCLLSFITPYFTPSTFQKITLIPSTPLPRLSFPYCRSSMPALLDSLGAENCGEEEEETTTLTAPQETNDATQQTATASSSRTIWISSSLTLTVNSTSIPLLSIYMWYKHAKYVDCFLACKKYNVPTDLPRGKRAEKCLEAWQREEGWEEATTSEKRGERIW